MKHLMKAMLMASFLFFISANAEAKKIRIAVEGAYPPFSYYTPEGNLAGFDIDIAVALCEAMNAECELIAQDWDGILLGLKSGKYDAIIASMTITEERKLQVDFTDKYYVSHPKFLARKRDLKRILVKSLENEFVGIVAGTTHEDFMNENNINTMNYSNFDDAVQGLFAGDITAIAGDHDALAQKIIQSENGDQYTFLGPVLENGTQIIVPKTRVLDVLINGFDGMTVGVQRSTAHSSFLEDKYSGKLRVVQYDTQDNVNLDMFNARIDLILADYFVVLQKVIQSDQGDQFTFIGPYIAEKVWYGDGETGIAIRKGDDELREKFNEAIQILRQNGKYKEISDKYFPFDIYGD